MGLDWPIEKSRMAKGSIDLIETQISIIFHQVGDSNREVLIPDRWRSPTTHH